MEHQLSNLSISPVKVYIVTNMARNFIQICTSIEEATIVQAQDPENRTITNDFCKVKRFGQEN